MSVVTSAANDSLTFNNTGVLSVAGSNNQITVANSSGAVSLTLPQSIGTSSAVTFGSATLGNIRISNTANQIDTSSGNLTLDSAGGTTTINDTVSIAGPLTVTSTNATTLGGAVTLNSTLDLSASNATITLGNSLTSISRANAVSGDYIAAGDMILRVKNAGELFLIRSDTNTTTALVSDIVITQGKLNTAISGLAGTYMSVNGARLSNNTDQILGTAGSGSFIVAQGAGSGTAKLTIASNGAATFANALTVSTGGLNIVAGGLTSVGTTSLTGAVTINNTGSAVDSSLTLPNPPTSPNHAANKSYVDTAINLISGSNAYPELALKKLSCNIPTPTYTIEAVNTGDGKIVTHDLTASPMVAGVPRFYPSYHGANGVKSVSITINENTKYFLIHFSGNGTLVAGTNYTASNLYTVPFDPVPEMLARRSGTTGITGTAGTTQRIVFGSIFNGAATGGGPTTIVVATHNGNSPAQMYNLILLRVA